MSNLHIHSIRKTDVKRPDLHPSKESAEKALTAFTEDVMKARETHGVNCVLISAEADFKKEDDYGSMGCVQRIGNEIEALRLIMNAVQAFDSCYDTVTEEPK